MAKNLKIESTDSELDQRIAQLQPYSTVQITITTARPSVQQEDGGTEYAEPQVQNLSELVPGRELAANMELYADRVEDFKQQFPDFAKYVGQNIEIPLSVRDEILRQPNGPDIALFLGFAPDVIGQLVKMHPLDAAKCIESISEDLERATLPGERAEYGAESRRSEEAESREESSAEAEAVTTGGYDGRETEEADFSGSFEPGAPARHLRARSRLRQSAPAAGRVAKSLASRQACKTEEIKMRATKPWPLLLRQQIMPSLCLRVRTVLDLEPCVAVVFVYPHLAFCHDSLEVPLANVLEELLAGAVDVLGIQ